MHYVQHMRSANQLPQDASQEGAPRNSRRRQTSKLRLLTLYTPTCERQVVPALLSSHPACTARALSWVHPQFASLCELPGKHLVTADLGVCSLETPPEVDGTPTTAMKATKLLTSSVCAAKQLQRLCDKSHVHQSLVGGSRKGTADYPLPRWG